MQYIRSWGMQLVVKPSLRHYTSLAYSIDDAGTRRRDDSYSEGSFSHWGDEQLKSMAARLR